MVVFILVMVLMVAYVGNGVRFARKQFAIENFRYSLEANRVKMNKAKLFTLESDLRALPHKSHCYLNYKMLSRDGCNCPQQVKWKRLTADVRAIKEGQEFPPEVSKRTILVWPSRMLEEYIKGGRYQPKYNDPDYTKMLESQIYQLELEGGESN